MGKRYRKWQERHDDNLTERYDRLPGPLQKLAGLYPSQQRQKQRDSGRRTRLNTPPPPGGPPAAVTAPEGPPPGWYADPTGETAQRWWDGSVWTEHTQ